VDEKSAFGHFRGLDSPESMNLRRKSRQQDVWRSVTILGPPGLFSSLLTVPRPVSERPAWGSTTLAMLLTNPRIRMPRVFFRRVVTGSLKPP
jgi:hypothetical protein